jgi:hypothetical protein
MLGSIKNLFDRSPREPVWVCSVRATPRVGTENERLYASAQVTCYIRTPMRTGAVQGASHLLDENGWEPVDGITCDQLDTSTLSKEERDLYREAVREGEAIRVSPQPKNLAASNATGPR